MIRFSGVCPPVQTPYFGKHNEPVAEEIAQRLGVTPKGDILKLSFPKGTFDLKASLNSVPSIDYLEAPLIRALSPETPADQRKAAWKELEHYIAKLNDRQDAMALNRQATVALKILVATHKALRDQAQSENKGKKITVPKSFLKKMLKAVSGGTAWVDNPHLNWYPQEYDGAAFSPDVERAYLKALLNNNHNDDPNNRLTRSVLESGGVDRLWVLQEADRIRFSLALELLEEAMPRYEEELKALQEENFAKRADLPARQEIALINGHILKPFSYRKSAPSNNRFERPQDAFNILQWLWKKGLTPPGGLVPDLFKLSLEHPDFVLDTSKIDLSAKGGFGVFEGQYRRTLTAKARDFGFLADLLDKTEVDSLFMAHHWVPRIKELVDEVPSGLATDNKGRPNASTIMECVDIIRRHRRDKAIEAWNSLEKARRKIPEELSRWLMDIIAPESK